MASPVNSLGDPILTKIAPSARPASQHVPRETLLHRLDEVVCHRLTLLHAPAGYGKTSLLGQWHRLLAERGIEVAWLTLEEEESDAARFAEYLMAAIGGSNSGESMPTRAALSAIVNRLSLAERDTVLILDDFHRAESEAVCHFVRGLIKLAPPRLHIVIASRDYPNLGQAVLAANEDLVEIGIEDLKFTLDEAQLMLSRGASVPLAEDDIARLLKRTEGWPIALQMTALSLRKGCDRAELIANFSGPAWELASYLSEQVLASLPPDIESIITRTAILERLNGDLVNLLCERSDGQLMLEQLEKQNLFLLPLDAQHLTYRYHQLFAQILRDRLVRRDPAAFRQLHRKAAHWFSTHGQIAEAVGHAIGAADEEFLAVILDDAGGWRMIPEGRMETLIAGLAHLSSATIARFPRLQLANVYRLIKQGQMTTARTSYDAFRNSMERSSLPADLWTEVNLVGEVLSEYENTPVRLEDLLAKEALILSLPSHDHLMLANVCESLGEKYCDCGWLERALEPTRRAREHHRALGSLYGEMFARLLEARIRLAQGRLDEAQVVLKEAAADIHHNYGPRSDLAANCAVYQAETLFERDAVDEASALLDWALPHMEQSDGWFEIYASGFCTAIRAAFGNSPAEAERMLMRMRTIAGRRHLTQLQLLADVYEVESLIHAGRNDAARERADEIGMSSLAAAMSEEVPAYRHIALAASVCLAKLHLCAGDHQAAMAEIDSTERWARKHGQSRLLITLCILAAHAHRLAKAPEQAITRFDEAVSMSMFQGFISPFLDCWRFISISATIDARHATARNTDRFRENFLRRLRKSLERHSAQSREATLLSGPELSALRHLDQGYTNKEIARLLKISPNTVKYHLKSLYEKLGVNSRRDAVRLSREQKLLDGASDESH
ncbi:LuxR C-terminal-related transcriptional regulator [Steroidobacter sp.]|uniref:LuxR C-terminal-related transcriptional regulator n=1 Tax=Steroidobacter sp. TaxID=1978227 RepID=UPI001A4CA46D|nr:LuxR C-terminal-related transcriptional regulator [Steroidobacter sp.]MBL8267202.1 helix-turn-helix domain-containing protein [Steroidobacter sp.]